MSVIPLSKVQPSDEEIERYRETERVAQEQKDKHESALDAVAAEMADKLVAPSEDRKEKKGLDELLNEGLEKAYDPKPDDREQIYATREDRETLKARYGEGGKLSDVLDRFMGWHGALTANPSMASEKLASDYMQQFRFGDDEAKAREEKFEDVNPNDKLGMQIAKAQAEAEAREKDNAEYEASAEQIKALKERFPGMSVEQAIKRAVQLDTEMRKDPEGTARKIAASYGAPVTPLQQETAKVYAEADAAIEATETLVTGMKAAGHLPHYDNPEVPNLMGRLLDHPQFPWSGNLRQDIKNAHDAAVLHMMQQRQEQQDAVAKAKRAAPVKVSGGHASTSKPTGPRGLDGAIGAALGEMGS